MIHRGVIVRHSRHRIRRRNAMALTLHSGVAFTHECADPGWSKDPGHQHSQENDRSCGSLGHFPKLYLRLPEMRKLGSRGFPQLPGIPKARSPRAGLHVSFGGPVLRQ